jgi:polysaccharide biosynthesis transport protein
MKVGGVMETVRSLPVIENISAAPEVQWDEPTVKNYLWIILKHKWMMVAFIVAFVSIVSVYNFATRPRYLATTDILIEKEDPNVLGIKEVLTVESSDVVYFQTQYQLLMSRTLAAKVIKTLKLENNPEFTGQSRLGGLSSLSRAWSHIITSNKPEPTSDQRLVAEELMLNAFLSRLNAEPVKNSRLVRVSFSGYNPETIANIIKTLSRLYIQQDLDRKLQASNQAVSWLSQQLNEMKVLVERSELALRRYKDNNAILVSQDRANLLDQRLLDLNSALSKVKTDRVALDAVYKRVKELTAKPGGIESIPPVQASVLIQNLKEDFIKAQTRLAGLSTKLSKEHPTIRELQSEVENSRSLLHAEVDMMVRGVETECLLAKAKEDALNNALEALRRTALEQDRKSIQLGVLQREVDTNRQLYDVLLRRLKETSLTGELRSSNIWVIDEAKTPTKPVAPRKLLNLFLAIIAALSMAIGLAFFFEYMDDTIKSPEEVEQSLKMPYLGAITQTQIGKKAKPEAELFTMIDPKSHVSESFRNIRTSILLSAPDEPRKTTLITSAGAGDGKTLVTANLAITMAQMGHRVLVVDTDMRRPRLHFLFGSSRRPGLSNLFATDINWRSVVQETAIPNMYFMPSGDTPPNPSELLASKRMQHFLIEAKELYDYIFFDSSPVMSVTDPVVLANSLDNIILVARAGITSRRAVRRTIRQLRAANKRILGVVLNGVDVRRDSYYYYAGSS